jgi:CubicO group peptidase (beta-lactamase class C family)/D-alanyl-D-alanine dipeptidase
MGCEWPSCEWVLSKPLLSRTSRLLLAIELDRWQVTVVCGNFAKAGKMKPWWKRVVFGLCGLVCSNCLVAQEGRPRAMQIQEIVREVVDREGIPGISVAVAVNNAMLYADGHGYADVENLVPATSETRYRTASIAKPMTAVTLLSLMEQGAIDLDRDVQGYCSDYPSKPWPISCRQLLGHLSGIRHYKNSDESLATAHFWDLRSALTTFRDDPLEQEPGTKYLYSTFGYNLLGSVAEGATQQAYDKLLDANVLRPAGMTQTVVDQQFAIVSGRARGYWRPTSQMLRSSQSGLELVAGELYNAPLHDTSMKIPGGGLLSTAPDLVRFALALNTDKLLQPSTRQLMWTEQRTREGQATGYGLGWRISRLAGRKVVSHTGAQSGTSTVLVLVPETGTAVALMCNLQNVRLETAALKIAEQLQPSATKRDYAEIIQKLEAAVRYEVDQKQLPAFSMALVDSQQTVWAEGFGFQDAAQTQPATAETVYRVGSISKLFTDVAIMQLVEQAQLELDTPVQQLLPEFAPQSSAAASITLRQLMSHRSGLVRESPVGNYFDPTEPTLAETVASLNETALIYPPDTRTKYSNAAIAVVGSVLERASGRSHTDYVRTAILDPLEMQKSSFVVSEQVEKQLATGWMQTYDGRRFEAPTFLLGTGPAGNMFSSVVDLAKFLKCLFLEGSTPNGPILKPQTYQQMTTPVRDTAGKAQDFGIGFHIQDFDGEPRVGHGGAVYGFATQLEALPDRQLGVVAVAALDGSNGVVRRLCDYALRLLKAKQDNLSLPVYRRTVAVETQRTQSLVGLYAEVEGARTARITAGGEDVHLQLGSYCYQVRAAEDDGTLLTDDCLGFGLELHDRGDDQVAIGGVTYKRTDDSLPPDIPERWQGLIGEYGWDHNTLYILEDQGKLVALIEWFYCYPLTEVDENTFAFPDYGLYHGERLEFVRDATGLGTQVTAAEVKFMRRSVGTAVGETFKIAPVKPISDLRAAALTAQPPSETGDFLAADLVEPVRLEPSIHLDIRYASTNNFTGAVFYQQPRAFLQRPAAEAVVRAHRKLNEHQLGVLIHDAYRPWYVTKMFWDATPNEFKDFVANPANGSRHNRGCAVDLTLVDLASGEPIQMVAGYDEFSPRSFPRYPGGTSRQRWYRELLRSTMESEGFSVYEFEWWHFDYHAWKQYRVQNVTFEELVP